MRTIITDAITGAFIVYVTVFCFIGDGLINPLWLVIPGAAWGGYCGWISMRQLKA
ncbi:MAG TPA: hypothetical protein VJX74_02050 [Blastocatellia bacterium]|nr:hypothetical protein [Blastocatellia bacterium]